MVDYMVRDMQWNDYCVFATEEDAREYIKEMLDSDPASATTDFKLFKREEIAL